MGARKLLHACISHNHNHSLNTRTSKWNHTVSLRLRPALNGTERPFSLPEANSFSRLHRRPPPTTLMTSQYLLGGRNTLPPRITSLYFFRSMRGDNWLKFCDSSIVWPNAFWYAGKNKRELCSDKLMHQLTEQFFFFSSAYHRLQLILTTARSNWPSSLINSLQKHLTISTSISP